MIIAPFVNVIAMMLLIDAIILASLSGVNNPNTEKIIKLFTTYLFPFFLLYGFCTSSGIYMIVSLLDKEKKMR